MKNIISASRRTDLVASFPRWLADVLHAGRADVLGPSRRSYTVDLRPESVHTLVLWSKDFRPLLDNRFRLKKLVETYSQIYLHFTITGLGGSFIEKGVPDPISAVGQLDALIETAGDPERVTVRFDPIILWEEDGKTVSNLSFFQELAPELQARGVRRIRISFAQWYGKARRRADRKGFAFIDPSETEKLSAARILADAAAARGLSLFACSQSFLTSIPGIQASACIDGALLQRLHPTGEPAALRKDASQRRECRCTQSVDIGSYTQSCPHSCLYCYANPRV